MTKKKFNRIYEMLLTETELLAKEGTTTGEMARVLSVFLVQLTFDCAPSTDHALHLIMTAVMDRLEENMSPPDESDPKKKKRIKK